MSCVKAGLRPQASGPSQKTGAWGSLPFARLAMRRVGTNNSRNKKKPQHERGLKVVAPGE